MISKFRFFASRLFFLLILPIGFISSCSNSSSKFSSDILADEIKAHIAYLSSDSLKGRDTGSIEEVLAANYIIERFKEAELVPLGDANRFTQQFDVVKGMAEGENGSLVLLGKTGFSSKKDSILAWGGSAAGKITSNLVLAGYGITAPDLKFVESTSQVKGKIALIMRLGPDGENNPHSEFGSFWDLDKKVSKLIEAGVAGIIITDGPLYESSKLNLSYKRGKARDDVPVVQVSSKIASQIIKEALNMSFQDYQKKLNTTKNPNLILSKQDISISVDLHENIVIAKNVVGLVKGKGRTNKAFVIGAHYDHLGMGGSGSLATSKEPQIHNGADDNASGTAGVIELAHYFSHHPIDHDLVFIAFSGEEMGLLGSDFYANNSTYPLENIRAMINMDMVGRMNNRSMLIFGTGTSNSWDSLLVKENKDSLDIKYVPDGTGASDHTSFYNKEIPVLHYFTDTHSDYHRPSDDVEYINAFGEKMLLDHVVRVVKAVDKTNSEEFYYTKAPETQRKNMRMSGTTLGVLPDYGYRGEGMRITGAGEGRPGANAGLKDGDILIELGGKKLKDIYDYMEALNMFKKGDKSTVVIKRGEETLTLPVTF